MQITLATEPLRTLEIDPDVVVSVLPVTPQSCEVHTRGGDRISLALSAEEAGRRLGL